MALARARTAAKKTKDRWKAKQWYKVTAPASFNNTVLAETLSDEPDKLAQRTIQTTLQELTGDMKLMHVKLTFQVKEVSDLNAKTEFVGHEMTSDYVRRLVRRGNSKIPLVLDVTTKDGSSVRVKPFAVTDRRCQTTQGQQIRRIMGEMITESAQKNNLGGFLQDILVGGLNERIYQACRKIHPLRRIEIAKSEIVTSSALVDETPIIAKQSEAAPEGAAPVADAGEEGKVEDLAAGDEEE